MVGRIQHLTSYKLVRLRDRHVRRRLVLLYRDLILNLRLGFSLARLAAVKVKTCFDTKWPQCTSRLHPLENVNFGRYFLARVV